MNKLLCLVSLLILTTINVIGQKWELHNYLDDFGAPSGKKYITYTTEGTYGSYAAKKVKIEITRDLGTSKFFSLFANWSDGSVVKVGEICRGTIHFGQVFTFVFRYKTVKKTSSFILSNSIKFGDDISAIKELSSKTAQIQIDYSELNAVLLSTSSPIKCVIAGKEGDNLVPIISFSLNTANYKK